MAEPVRCDEWLAGTVAPPSNGQHQHTVITWYETATGLLVGMRLTLAGRELAEAPETFREAVARPLAGEPRRPQRVRVASEQLAAALRGALGDDVEVVVAPTPELEPVLAELLALLSIDTKADREADASHFSEDTRPDQVAAFYDLAAELCGVAPWRRLPEDAFVEVSCPALGISEGMLGVVGQAGTSFGFSLFWSAADARAYLKAAESDEMPTHLPAHVRFEFVPRKDCPPSIAREAAEAGWPVTDGMHPNAVEIDVGLVPRPLAGDELVGLTAIIGALTALCREPGLDKALDSDEELQMFWEGEVEIPGSGSIAVRLAAPLWIDDIDDDDDLDDHDDGDDERDFAMFKRLGEQAGYDMSTEAGMMEFVAAVAGGGSPPPDEPAKSKQPKKRRALQYRKPAPKKSR